MCYVSLLFWLPLLLRLTSLIHYPDSALDQSPRPSCNGPFQCIWTISLPPSMQRCHCVIDKCVQCASQSMATEALTRKMLHCPFSMLPITNETAQAVVHKNIIHLGRPFSGWLPHSAHSCLSNVLRCTFTVVHQKIQSQSWDWTLELGFQNMLCHLVHKVILNIFKEINRWGLECLENGFLEWSHFEISYFTLVRSTNLKPSSSCLTINSKFVLVPLNHLKR